MASRTKYTGRLLSALLSFLLFTFWLSPRLARAQDSSNDMGPRGDRAEIAVTVRDSSGEPVKSAGNVKLYREGMPSDQVALSRGRAFFLLRLLGNYTLVVDAAGYKPAQRDINVPVAVKYEVDVSLERAPSSNEVDNVPGKPVLAPKAKEALEKALQALNDNKLDAAQKFLDEAMRLAPGHPDVLYAQGVIFLKHSEWAKAQSVLETAAQVDPNNARTFSALGMAFVDQGKYEQAIPPLEHSLQLEPVSWETHWILAKAYYRHRQYDVALKESQEAWNEPHGATPEVELLLAQSFAANGHFEEAAQTLRDYLKKFPKDPGAATARKWLDRLVADGKIRNN